MLIMSSDEIENFVDALRSNYNDGVSKALNLLIKHKSDFKYRNISVNGEKFQVEAISHELSVCNLASSIAKFSAISNTSIDVDAIIQVALLHDLYEDVENVDFSDFSEEVVNSVYKLSRNHEEYAGYSGMNAIEQLVKACDRCCNLITMLGIFSKTKCERYLKDSHQMLVDFERNDYGLFAHLDALRVQIKNVERKMVSK